MANATKATVQATGVATPLPTGVVFGHWNFDFVDAAGTKAPTQVADGVSVTSAQFDISAAAAGAATFTITAVDANGTPIPGAVDTITATLPFAISFMAPSAGMVAFT